MDAAERERLLRSNAEAYARVALSNVRREYPTSVPYYLTAPGPLRAPRELHPSFYGSFDWHSSVEMHWVLVRLLHRFPDLPFGQVIRALLDDHFVDDKLATEAAYFTVHRGFERPYGWGWALRLANELRGWDDRDGARWRQSFAPLATILRDAFCAWLPKATYPQRTGLHGNSAFALLLALDFAEAEDSEGRPELVRAIHAAAFRWYAKDAGYPAHFEPSGSDFLSPALTEAALMARLVGRSAFGPWLDQFLRSVDALLIPAVVTDPTDGQIAHLHGLNLSRAYCMRLIVEALPSDHRYVSALERAIATHAEASFPFVVESNYMLEHWLAAYALLLLD